MQPRARLHLIYSTGHGRDVIGRCRHWLLPGDAVVVDDLSLVEQLLPSMKPAHEMTLYLLRKADQHTNDDADQALAVKSPAFDLSMPIEIDMARLVELIAEYPLVQTWT